MLLPDLRTKEAARLNSRQLIHMLCALCKKVIHSQWIKLWVDRIRLHPTGQISRESPGQQAKILEKNSNIIENCSEITGL